MENTFRSILIILGCLNQLGLAAESYLSISEVDSLSIRDFQLHAEQTVELSGRQCNDLMSLIDTLIEEPEDRLKDLLTELGSPDNSVRIISYSGFLHVDSIVNLDVFRELSNHRDISIRYLSMLFRITNDDMLAAKDLKDLITSRALSLDEKRILRTWCEVGCIDVIEDSASDIYDHIRTQLGSADLRPKIGEQAPSFEVEDIKGNIVKSADYRGKPVLLHFWSTTCPPCMDELDDLNSSLNPLLEDELIVVIGVSVDRDIDRCREAIEEHNLNWIHVCDGKSWGTQLARLYKVHAIPEDFIIDQNGIVVAHDVKKLIEMCPVKETESKRDMEYVSLGLKVASSSVLALVGIAFLLGRRNYRQNRVTSKAQTEA